MQKNLDTCTITIEPLTYTGKTQEPDITITDGDYTLVKGVDYTFLKDGDSVTPASKAGVYELTIRGMGDYIGDVAVTWSIERPDSAAPTYSISAVDAENGTVTVSPKNAARTTTVTVTATPDAGYELESLTVWNENGNELELTDKGNGKYTFKMPNGEVEIEAVFAEISTAAPEIPVNFADVSGADYFYDAVRWAVKTGVTTGVGDNCFGPP